MKVLVTGGAGYIGNCVVEELLTRNHAPVVFDAFYWGRQTIEKFVDKIEVFEV